MHQYGFEYQMIYWKYFLYTLQTIQEIAEEVNRGQNNMKAGTPLHQ